MSNLGGKLSFGFSKVIKKPNLLKNNSENVTVTKNVQLIDSIEGSELKVLGKDGDSDKPKDLVIPLTEEQKSRPIAKLIESRRDRRNRKRDEEDTNKDEERLREVNGNSKENATATADAKENDVEETLEQRAAREILEDLQNNETKNESKVLELPIHPDELPLNGAVEATLDDYERIPIADFGKAMLRGMGWKEEKKDEKDDPGKFDIFVRPKGLGLGADKVVKKQKLLVSPAPNETLEIKKKACIKILAGKHKNQYGTIEGFDDGGGRLIIKLAIGGLKVQMNEFMVQPVPKQEFAKYSKILNSEKYEEYKSEDGNKQRDIKQEKKSCSPTPVVRKRDKSKSPSTSRARERERSKSLERYQQKPHKTAERNRSRERRRSRERSPPQNSRRERSRERRNRSSDSEDDKTSNRKYNEKHRRSRSHERHRRRHSSSSDSHSERHNSKKKSSKKTSKSKSKKNSSDDEKVHKKKYKRSKHHRDRS